MEGIKELSLILGEKLSLNKYRLECLAILLVSMILGQTTNLKKLCVICDVGSKATSCYRRFQRFFASCCLSPGVVGEFIVHLFYGKNDSFYLTLDRTNWQLGSHDINFLVLGAAYQGISLPLWWTVLDKRGNSSTPERIRLITSFIARYGKHRIAGILADREFVGKEWFSFLISQGIPFVIRIKNNTKVINKGQEVHVKNLFQDLAAGQKRVLKKTRIMWELDVYLSATRSAKGELVILATHNEATYSLALYARRWSIENLFQSLKGRGFNMEDTRITDHNRLETFMAVLALAFAWAHKTGEWLASEIKPLTIKKHGRPIMSIFRYGLDALRKELFALPENKNHLMEFFSLLRGSLKTSILQNNTTNLYR